MRAVPMLVAPMVASVGLLPSVGLLQPVWLLRLWRLWIRLRRLWIRQSIRHGTKLAELPLKPLRAGTHLRERDFGLLLRAPRERPGGSAAEKRDEVASLHLPPHSITSSARAGSVG